MSHSPETALRRSATLALVNGAAALLCNCWRAGRRWHSRRAAMADLHSLDERMLKDLGIERSEIEAAVRGLHRDRSRLSHG